MIKKTHQFSHAVCCSSCPLRTPRLLWLVSTRMPKPAMLPMVRHVFSFHFSVNIDINKSCNCVTWWHSVMRCFRSSRFCGKREDLSFALTFLTFRTFDVHGNLVYAPQWRTDKNREKKAKYVSFMSALCVSAYSLWFSMRVRFLPSVHFRLIEVIQHQRERERERERKREKRPWRKRRGDGWKNVERSINQFYIWAPNTSSYSSSQSEQARSWQTDGGEKLGNARHEPLDLQPI